jgi:hypothetical protein
LVGFLLSSTAGAAEGGGVGKEVPTVRQVLDRYVEATGGRAALEKLKSREMKGTIEVTALGTGGAFLLRAKVPNRQMSTLEFGGFGAMREGYDGTVAWSTAPLQGVKRKTGAELARVRRTTVFPRELKLAETYDRLEVKGAAKVGTVDTWLVVGESKEGKPDHLYFDQKSGLLLREESTVPTGVGEMTFQIDFEDYRVVDGVKVAHRMRVPQPPEMGFRIQFESVKHNLDFADSVFAEPSE